MELPVVVCTMPIRRLSFYLFLACTSPCVLRAAPIAADHARVELVSESVRLAPGQIASLGLRIEHERGWHTYWINPGDSGLPTRLVWTLPAGYLAGEIAWPAPKRFDAAELSSFGYDGTTLLPVSITVPATAQVGTVVHLAVDAKWLVCHEECVPGRATLTLDLPIADSAAPDPAQRSAFAAARAAQPQPVPWQARARLSGDRVEILVHGANVPRGATLDAFAVQTRVVANARPQIETRGDDLALVFAKSDYFGSMPPRLDLVLLDGSTHARLLSADGATAASSPHDSPR